MPSPENHESKRVARILRDLSIDTSGEAAWQAIISASGDTMTDSLNKALQCYAEILFYTRNQGGAFLESAEGEVTALDLEKPEEDTDSSIVRIVTAVNLSHQSSLAYDDAEAMTNKDQSQVVNAALRLYAQIKTNQDSGGVTYVPDFDGEHIAARYY